MSEQIKKINYCRYLISICSCFSDIEYQKRCWFRLEGPEVGSYDDDHYELIKIAETLHKCQKYLNDECLSIVNHLIEKVQKFDKSDESPLLLADENDLFQDNGWLEIVRLSRKAMQTLTRFEKELLERKNGKTSH